ncbi:hypothetical protein MKW94_007362 [Papaver nudicaule]|uniref:Uncharacterized protein n=1 Tax=Papaver nudicaule TaxID=74823 RepID=A0AA41V6U8_PAPNU|nr:hypothetical protein [Papaver nudicaule]
MSSLSTPLHFFSTPSKRPAPPFHSPLKSSFLKKSRWFSVFQRDNNPPPKRAISCSYSKQLEMSTDIGVENVEPPWRILPPVSPETMFTGDVDSFLTNLSMETVNGNGLPYSLQIIKMKTKLTSNVADVVPMTIHSSIVKSMSSVLLMVDELLKTSSGDVAVENPITVSREMSDSMVLLLKKTCVTSPSLFMLVMNLVADYIVVSSANAVSSATSNVLHTNLFDLGVRRSSSITKVDKCLEEDSSLNGRRCYYERLVYQNPNSSLILANYAQFLYHNLKDNNRAEEMFLRAMKAEPVDAEVLSRYALFLWHQRNDVGGAEDYFQAAIDVDPSTYHQSTYAWFLMKTGASDTCFPLDS